MTKSKRICRYHNLYTNNNDGNLSSPSYFNELASSYKENDRKGLLNWDKPLFGNKHTSLQKVLANAKKTLEKSTKFINKIKSRQLACANRAKSIPKNATIRKEYINCGKEICQHKHGPYCYAYWKILKAKS